MRIILEWFGIINTNQINKYTNNHFKKAKHMISNVTRRLTRTLSLAYTWQTFYARFHFLECWESYMLNAMFTSNLTSEKVWHQWQCSINWYLLINMSHGFQTKQCPVFVWNNAAYMYLQYVLNILMSYFWRSWCHFTLLCINTVIILCYTMHVYVYYKNSHTLIECI